MKLDIFPTDEFETAHADYYGVNSSILDEIENEEKLQNQLNAVVIIKNGVLIYDKYFNGKDPQTRQDVKSATKSVVSTLIGVALEKGYIGSVNDKVVKYFPEYKHYFEGGKDKITIENLLTMTSGISWENSGLVEITVHDMIKTGNWTEFILSRPFSDDNFGKFNYSSANSHLLSAIITKTTGKSALEFAKETLFKYLKIDTDKWIVSPEGVSAGGFGLYISAEELAKIGLLYLTDGMWEDERLLSFDWVEKVSQEHSSGLVKYKYSYQWWLRDVSGYKTYSMRGKGGQICCCIPELEMVVVVTSAPESEKWQNPDIIIDKYIIPALIK